jgi:hypothetical protein
MAFAVESHVSKLPQTLGMKFGWKIRSMIERSKSSRSYISKKELKVMRSLPLNKNIRILKAKKGNCPMVLDESEYKDKLNNLLESGFYEPLSKDLKAKVNRKDQELLSKQKSALVTDLKHGLHTTANLHIYKCMVFPRFTNSKFL